MKRIISLFLTVLIFSIVAICNCYATPILWSSSTVDLANLNIITTNTLSISLDNTTPEQLVSRSEVYLEDLEPFNSQNQPYNWTGYDFSGGDYTITFLAIGSGVLEISVDTRWQYDIEPWAIPDKGLFIWDVESHETYFSLTNEDTGETTYGGTAGFNYFSDFDQTFLFASDHGIFFDEGQTGRLSIRNDVHSGGFYTEVPSQPAAVPEPASILLLGTGLIGFIKLRRKGNRMKALGNR